MRLTGSVDSLAKASILLIQDHKLNNQLTPSQFLPSFYKTHFSPFNINLKFKPFFSLPLPLHKINNNTIINTIASLMGDSDSRVEVDECDKNAVNGNGFVDPSCTEIIIVRHGETDWNALGKMQGQLDVELNEVGKQQADAVADRLSRERNISAIYSSDLKRAHETAEIIATRCGGLEVISDQDLRERHLGDLQGLVYQELAKLNPKAYEAFKSPKLDQEIPGGGESRIQLYNRCTSALQRIGDRHRGQRVVVVTHGGLIRSLYIRAAPNGPPAKRIMNTSVGIIQLSDGDVWSVKSWNDISHLSETGFLKSGFGGDASSG